MRFGTTKNFTTIINFTLSLFDFSCINDFQVDFAMEMKAKLDEINKHSFNSFQLRIGKPVSMS